jgi:hypothetical protein
MRVSLQYIIGLKSKKRKSPDTCSDGISKSQNNYYPRRIKVGPCLVHVFGSADNCLSIHSRPLRRIDLIPKSERLSSKLINFKVDVGNRFRKFFTRRPQNK